MSWARFRVGFSDLTLDPNCSLGLQAVLIEHDEVAITDLSAVVTSNGQKGENLIKDYDEVSRSWVAVQRQHVFAWQADNCFPHCQGRPLLQTCCQNSRC